ncbi:acyl-CoA reductase-like NAD-dependent aldehyde dehydrogenase [Nocardia kruczakiae]|uniref:Acyl-CoA reductase-like NAD-dependent aldehyde dehydrogenase n=1 Tax=Nocardia kruczakiae TaxID=261477 RepID=A0ABU1X8P1_9NOCA|nr:aldehyde dehydrogenase [Nocardia kruczakiae]MDR7166908.1 acyl-CoA reductase-like NAD-dependent aldehyde dehydrogenase [Nocardia kruczakiae]
MVYQGNYSKLFIGGRWADPTATEKIAVISPYTEQTVAHVPNSAASDVDRAVAAARHAFDHGPWPQLSLPERIEVLTRVSAGLGERQEEIAELITTEMGSPITLSRSTQSLGAKLLLDAFLGLAPSYEWSSIRRSATGTGLVTREPIGVVAAVIPWNMPLQIAMLKLGPALLAGCTVVLKTAPEAPLNGYILGEILQAAGLPDGVVNIVPADRGVSEHLVTHPGIDKVSFTGSTAAGRRVAELCGRDLRRVTLELGGKSAAIVLDDADLDLAIGQIRKLSMRNNGQACSNKTRIVVARSHEAELVERLVAMVEAMPVGDPSDAATEIGPVVSARQRAMIESYLEIGRNEGAKIAVGGGRPAGLDRGWFVEPTVFTGVAPDMRIAQEEIFGPVLSVLSFADEDEAVAIANNSMFGLNGSVFTADDEHALAVARRIRTGTVELNGNIVGFHSPIGGFKCSGIGREAGLEGFDGYVEPKSYGLSASLAESLS